MTTNYELENLVSQLQSRIHELEDKSKHQEQQEEIEMSESNRQEVEKARKHYNYSKAFVYHPEEGERLVDAREIEDLTLQGWYDTPAKFPKESLVSQTKVDEKEDEIKRLREELARMQTTLTAQDKLLDAQKTALDSTKNHAIQTDVGTPQNSAKTDKLKSSR